MTTSTGAQCTLTFGVKPLESTAAPVGDAERAKVTATAEQYLKNLDVSALGSTVSTRMRSPQLNADSEAGAAFTVDEGEIEAVYKVVGQRLSAELTRQHLSPSAVSLTMASSCDSDGQ